MTMEHDMRKTAAALVCGWLAVVTAVAQTVDFKVRWSTLGEIATAGGNPPKDARVARVDVQPTVVKAAVGTQLCISSLQIHAFDADGRPVAGAPLSIAVREDQKQALQLTRPKDDICMRPASPGEYPIRFTSKLPARDSSVRGAQVFLRAS
jgi:hypothetical protein